MDLAATADGGCVESVAGRFQPDPGWAALVDETARRFRVEASPAFPLEVTLSFRNRGCYAIRSVHLEYPPDGIDPAMLPRQVRLLLSEFSATDGFRDEASIELRRDRKVSFSLPGSPRARFVRLVIDGNQGSPDGVAIGRIRVIGDRAPSGHAVDLAGPEYPGRAIAGHVSGAFSPRNLIAGPVARPGGLPGHEPWASRPGDGLPVTIDLIPFRAAPAFLETVVLDTRLDRESFAGSAPRVVDVQVSDEAQGSFASVGKLELSSSPAAQMFRLAPPGNGFPCRRVRLVVESLEGPGDRCALREASLFGRFRQIPGPGPVAECEPNDSPSYADPVLVGETLTGVVDSSDVDFIDLATTPDGGRLEVEGRRLEGTLVGLSRAGVRLFFVPVGIIDSRLVLPRISRPAGGRVMLRLAAASGTPGKMDYRCRLLRSKAADSDREVNDRLVCPRRVSIEPSDFAVLDGVLDQASDVDVFSFVVPPGQGRSYAFFLSKVPDRDTLFTLSGPDPDSSLGIPVTAGPPPLIRVVDDTPHPAQEAFSGFVAEAPGEYFISVSSRQPPGPIGPGAYTLTVKQRPTE
ncbi:MAG: hypothetical protein HY815_19460 [Candidatus Riflebacteria bacterium]|nr:hypothetical protein [Candidatus Riflebacteria bacterium]